jgi:hypothetical protein
MMIWRRLVLRFCIRSIDGELLAIMDYPRGSVKRRRDPSWQVIVISHEAIRAMGKEQQQVVEYKEVSNNGQNLG